MYTLVKYPYFSYKVSKNHAFLRSFSHCLNMETEFNSVPVQNKAKHSLREAVR